MPTNSGKVVRRDSTPPFPVTLSLRLGVNRLGPSSPGSRVVQRYFESFAIYGSFYALGLHEDAHLAAQFGTDLPFCECLLNCSGKLTFCANAAIVLTPPNRLR